jgi:transcriptional regulator with GAF, ATPase, and Fis domain
MITQNDPSINFGLINSDDTSLPELINDIANRLKEFFDINRALLVVRQNDTKPFSAVSSWHNGNLLDGLKLSLPKNTSLFENVAENRVIYTETYSGTFSGNFFEKKLLLDETSSSFLLQPIRYKGQTVGILGFSSENPTAFTMFEEGVLDKITDELGEIIIKSI